MLVEPFLGLNTSLKRPTGDGDLRDCGRGGTRPVELDADSGRADWEGSFGRSGKGAADSCCSDFWTSCRWSAWTSGEFVVRYPICEGWVEIMVVGLIAGLVVGQKRGSSNRLLKG